MIKLVGYTLAAVVLLGLILCVPFAVIWMINTFGETLWPDRVLPYTLETWAAACLLTGLFATGVNAKKK